MNFILPVNRDPDFLAFAEILKTHVGAIEKVKIH
jgi:hypothetical protein